VLDPGIEERILLTLTSARADTFDERVERERQKTPKIAPAAHRIEERPR
jgi:hypothetical protein